MQNLKTLKTFNMCNDHMFKSVFRSIEAREVVIDFLNAVTGIEKEKLRRAKFEGGEIVKSKITEKAKTSDVLVTVNDEEKLIVEINGSRNPNIFEKNSEYAFSIIVETTKSNKKYSKVILINIDDFNKFKTDKPILHFKIRDELGNIENDSYNSIHLILENIVNTEYNKTIDKRIVEFGKFLKTTNLDDMKKIFKGSDNYMAAIRRVEDLSTDPNFVGYYDIEEAREAEMEEVKEYARTVGIEEGRKEGLKEGLKEGRKEGLKEGREEGIKESCLKIAKSMKENGIDISIISKCTGLSINDIENRR